MEGRDKLTALHIELKTLRLYVNKQVQNIQTQLHQLEENVADLEKQTHVYGLWKNEVSFVNQGYLKEYPSNRIKMKEKSQHEEQNGKSRGC